MRYVAVADIGRACERTTAVGWLVTWRCPPSIGAKAGTCDRHRARQRRPQPEALGGCCLPGDCLELGHLPADDVPRGVLKPSGKASAPCLHRSRGRCLLSWQTGRRAWPGGGAIPASTYEPDNPGTQLVPCQPTHVVSAVPIGRSVAARPKTQGTRRRVISRGPEESR